MKPDEFHQLILSELKGVRTQLDDVRTKDIPGINTQIAGFNSKIKTLEGNMRWSTRLYTVLGGAIAVFIAKVTGSHN